MKIMNKVGFVSVSLKCGSIQVASSNHHVTCHADSISWTYTCLHRLDPLGNPTGGLLTIQEEKTLGCVFLTLNIISSFCVVVGATMLILTSQYSPWAKYSLTLIS